MKNHVPRKISGNITQGARDLPTILQPPDRLPSQVLSTGVRAGHLHVSVWKASASSQATLDDYAVVDFIFPASARLTMRERRCLTPLTLHLSPDQLGCLLCKHDWAFDDSGVNRPRCTIAGRGRAQCCPS